MMRERGGRLVDRYIDRQLRGLLGERAIDATIWRDLRQYEVIALAVIEQFWHIEVRGGEDYWHLLLPPRGDSTPDTLARGAAQVVERLGDEAGTSAAAFVLHPQLWSPAYTAWRGGSGGPGQFARARFRFHRGACDPSRTTTRSGGAAGRAAPVALCCHGCRRLP